MEMKREEDFLFTKFGLCPEYKVIRTEEEWVEFYDHNQNPWSYNPESALSEIKFYPTKIRLHLDTHLVEMPNNLTVAARFAVSHENKIIFLKVSRIGEIGRIMESYK